jgi:hypothetical protein
MRERQEANKKRRLIGVNETSLTARGQQRTVSNGSLVTGT